jgi:hypothetical protein
MGDELAYFKAIRLCSIMATLSNTITVVINGISRAVVGNFAAGPPKMSAAGPEHALACMIQRERRQK